MKQIKSNKSKYGNLGKNKLFKTYAGEFKVESEEYTQGSGATMDTSINEIVEDEETQNLHKRNKGFKNRNYQQ